TLQNFHFCLRLTESKISKGTVSRSPMSSLVVKELSPSLRDDFLLFFDKVAFADNLDWSDCYCSLYHFANKGKAESRRQASSFIEAYPVKKPPSAAWDFPGPLSMYFKNGFSTHRDADWYFVVRKRLETPG